MIRKPEGAERASALRRTAEAGLEARDRLHDVGRATGRGCQSLIGWYMAIMFLFGAITASSWGARIFGVCLVSFFIFIFRAIGKARREAERARRA